MPTLLNRIRQASQLCKDIGITMSNRKLKIGNSIKFAGFTVSENGVSLDRDKTKALSDFPVPTDVSSLRSFLGRAKPIGNNVMCIWSAEHQKAFDETKRLLTLELFIKPFDPTLPTELLTDASRLHGLGYMFLQREDSGKLRVIKCGSCGLTHAQTRYGTVGSNG
eukprot:TCALIF_13809-PA protein Name:"Similar to pol Retrovirus-related Pol polyprotein from transposon opus (Drosophila melanogaster)" AED:0.37 eAED:0.39 QI:0/0/0/1/1/1/2/0/164